MGQSISCATLLVKDYDEALRYFLEKLQFNLIEDTKISETKRWVLVSPGTPGQFSILLAKAVSEEQKLCIGNQTGGRVGFFLQTDDFDKCYTMFKNNGVTFLEEPRNEKYGRVVVFADLYGNKWDLLEHKKAE